MVDLSIAFCNVYQAGYDFLFYDPPFVDDVPSYKAPYSHIGGVSSSPRNVLRLHLSRHGQGLVVLILHDASNL